ncbi:MAG TPA: glycosyltransferase family 9 protein [Blastocatellia bacterium]|nr:glycosyltransferase family 9 protein [Blastocatellia bacterium]
MSAPNAKQPERPSDLSFPRIDWSAVNRVLFVRLRSIGDTVLLTPSLRVLKQFKPGIEISVVSEPYSAPLLENHPLVDRLLTVAPNTSSRIKLVISCRRARFDVAFNVHGGPTSNLITAFSGAKRTVGYGDYRYASLLKLRANAPDKILGRPDVHSVEQQMALMNWTGVPWPEQPPALHVEVSDEARAMITSRLAAAGLESTGFAIVAPAAAAESKRWPADRFADVVEHLGSYWRMRSVVIAGPGQERVAEDVAAASTPAPAVITGISLKELVALTSLASLFVGNDSGPMHIAAALGRPIVAVFGSSSPTVWHPWTESPYRVLEPPQSKGESMENPAALIPSRVVLAAVDEVIEAAVSAGTL